MARTLVLWCPDWPLTAAGVPPSQPAVVLAGRRVVVCSAAARAAGVRRGLRQREAQSRCPEALVLTADPDRDARGFSPIVAAVAALAPAVEVVRPGLAALDLRGPTRALGGEEAVAERLRTAVDTAVDVTGCRSGIADGPFGALLAARQAPAQAPGLTVPAGGDACFLAPLPIEALLHDATDPDVPTPARSGPSPRELVVLLRQLGITTLGGLAALPGDAVAERFGPLGTRAHRLARGQDDRRLVPIVLPPELSVQRELDPPAQLVEVAAFAARALADELLDVLVRRGLTCTVVAVEAETEHGEVLSQRWRLPEGLTVAAVVDRVRWQLDGWLTGTAAPRPTAPITLLRLRPQEVVDDGWQTSLLDDDAGPTPRVTRALARLQGMLGPDAVLVATLAGGRGPGEQVVAVPWDPTGSGGATRPRRSTHAGRTPADRARDVPPWPGSVPAPAPATVPGSPLPAEVVDLHGAPVRVSGRGAVTGAPARARVAGGPWWTVTGWAGPWLADERWWDRRGHRRARFQLAVEDGPALLAFVEDGCWQVEALYD